VCKICKVFDTVSRFEYRCITSTKEVSFKPEPFDYLH